ncbi:hypothetical protein Tco_0356640 [Tanacetum coccineum]
MTKVIKGEFEKIKDVKVEDVSLTCDKPLEVFNNEVNRLSRMDDDLFTYEVEVANIPCDSKMDDDSEHEADDDMGYDPSDIIRDDEVELIDEDSSDEKDEVAEVFRIDTNLFNFETPTCKAFKEFNYLLQIDPDLLSKDIEGFKTYEDYKDDWIYEWNKDVPWVDEKPWTNARVWTKPTPVKHTCKPFNYKTGCSEWPTCSWMDDGYCNGGNLPGTYIIGNQLHYQDYEWYEALEYSKPKDEALGNKAIMEGFIDDIDESRYEQMRRWNIYTNYDDAYEINHEDNEREELCEDHKLPYVAVKEDEYDNLTITREEACRAYQEIFRKMDEGWMTSIRRPRERNIDGVGGMHIYWNSMYSKRHAFWSLNEDILKITILKTNTPYPSRKIRRIRACTHQRPQKDKAQYAVSRETQYAVFKVWNQCNILEDIKRGPYSKKSPIRRDLDNSTSNVLIPLDSWTSGLLVYKLPLSDYGSGVAKPKIDNKDQFELKGQFLKELRENTFSGSDNKDANEHIEKVLEIVDLFYVPNIAVDQLMLRVFPISLTGAASRWLRNEPTGSIMGRS